MPLYLLRGPSSQTHPVSIPCSISYLYNVISFFLLKESLTRFRTASVISCLHDLVHIICSSVLFLCNKLLSNFLHCKTVICLFSRFCGSEIWKGLLGNLSLTHMGSRRGSWGWTVHFQDDGLWNALVWNLRVTWHSVCSHPPYASQHSNIR